MIRRIVKRIFKETLTILREEYEHFKLRCWLKRRVLLAAVGVIGPFGSQTNHSEKE